MAARVGLTGGIGSGKSTVADLFGELGVTVIDADQVARFVTRPGSDALAVITDKFGDGVLLPEGALDRKALGQEVFANDENRRWLEQLLHPLIRRQMDQQAAADRGAFCILEIPLLVETGRHRDMDCVVVVHCPRAVRIERLQISRGMSVADVERIMAKQASDEERLACADYRIDNNTDLDTLADRVRQVYRDLEKRFA